ncbi:type II secretion system protein E [Halobacillus sp. BAB-2008]|nr:type II secretion system protein E [Halobacillus sp. BAB-2008]
MTRRKRLGDLLKEAGVIEEAQIEEALKEKQADQKLGDVLVEKGYVTEQQLIEVLEFQLGIPRFPFFTFLLIPKLSLSWIRTSPFVICLFPFSVRVEN